MTPELIDEFENGNINIKVYRIGTEPRFWLRAGAALVELKVEDMVSLIELLGAMIIEAEEDDDEWVPISER